MTLNLRKECLSASGRGVRMECHFVADGGYLMRCFDTREAHLSELFSAAVRRTPDAEAIVDEHRRLTYRQLERRVAAVVRGMAELGLTAGDRLAFALDNRVEFIELLLACAHSRVIAVPLNVRMRRREIGHVLRDSAAAALVIEKSLCEELPDADEMPACRHTVVLDGTAAVHRTYADAFRDRAGVTRAPGPTVNSGITSPGGMADDEEAIAAIVYTSGTTGLPKGAAITHLGLIHTAISFEGIAGLRPGERTVLAVPASHITGIAAVIVPVLHLSGCVVLMRPFRAAGFAELAAREKCSYAFLVPAMVNLLMLRGTVGDHDLSAWRVLAFGGAPMPPATTAAIAAALPSLQLLQAYGATESTAAVTAAPVPRDADEKRLRSIGRILPCADVRIMDEAGREVPTGESGELWIGGPSVIPRYWGQPRGSSNSLVGGYWRSGDIGWRDAEGLLYIGDRKKDMINRAGFKIYSMEVEAVLMSHPRVDFAAVVGYPDPVLGEKSHAFLITRPGTDLSEIHAHCARQLSDYKVPDGYSLVDGEDLPRNAAGKVLKTELRQRLLDLAQAG